VKIIGNLVKTAGTVVRNVSFLACIAPILFYAGCASVSRNITHFEPVPKGEIDTVELEPVLPEGGGRLRLSKSHSESFSDLEIPHPLPEAIVAEIEELQHSYPKTFQRGLNRSTRYMPYIQEEFRKAGLPEDLAWLAMVESMFQPKVVSPAGAGGMWQFMRATGRRYDLRMDSYVDERYNWHSATQAAIEYLKGLHDFFDGDWALAVTAYNMGEGGLSRAISANNGEKDFFTLIKTPPACDRMKDESKKYYPRLISYILVARNPSEYGFTTDGEPFEDVVRIPVEGMYHLSDLDNALGLSRGTLASLNPDLLREATPPQGKYPVAVPREKHEQFLAALKNVKSVRYAGAHRVKRGETIAQIARKYGVCDKELMRINNIHSARSLQVNQTLQLPVTGMAYGGAVPEPEEPVPAPKAEQLPNQPPKTESPGKIYNVKPGDTLYDIACAHKVTVADLQRWNNLGSRSNLKVGQKLSIGGQNASNEKKESIKYHTVKPGEYPGVIAQLYGVSVSDLLKWNNLDKNAVIKAGDKLVIAGETSTPNIPEIGEQKQASTPQTSPPDVLKHKVAKGETPCQIATRYGIKTDDLLAQNNLTAKSIIRVGQELTIHKANKSQDKRDTSNDVTIAQAPKQKQTASSVVHKVTAGQNPTSIAKKYGVAVNDLFKWNNWKDKHILKVGDEVKIYRD